MRPSSARRPKLQMAQLLEALPRRAPLVLLEGEVPRLGGPTEMICRQPRIVRDRRVLAVEKLGTVIEPVERVFGAVVRRERQLVETQGGLALAD